MKNGVTKKVEPDEEVEPTKKKKAGKIIDHRWCSPLNDGSDCAEK